MEYTKKLQYNYSDKLCYSLLMQEPYWHEGYFYLFDSLYNQKRYKEALDCCQTAFRFGYYFEELFERRLECYKKTVNKNEFNKILTSFEESKNKRKENDKANQARLKFLVDEEWRRKLYLTRKLPIFNGE